MEKKKNEGEKSEELFIKRYKHTKKKKRKRKPKQHWIRHNGTSQHI